MSHYSRRIVTAGAYRKRKEREETFYPSQPSSPVMDTTSSKQADPVSSTRLLAGYMAHEFITKGTLLGQEFDPARVEAVPVNRTSEPRRGKPGQGHGNGLEPSQSYAEVASLLNGDGARIVGIVNPTQLGRWIQM
ncbi:PREDICTED: uncharacterized protein LOC109175400 [Ipomoea nil]|uniref:uncharacterized protein LOC109175400 n=1 Tax=Ipomoea nil TaxID=35883 RepID=UPI0009012292|nr:PREDICTED: uncharacterized protein LOC109175400 [Ipomoea nil]